MISVSWVDVTNEYLPWLSKVSGKPYRLLSEAEWEYAARARTTTKFAFGDTISKSQAQFSEGKFGSAGKTVEVGKFLPNSWGLYDMHGNVLEWVEDDWHENYQGPLNDGAVHPTSPRLNAFCAAVPGATFQTTSARPIARLPNPNTGASASASELPERFEHDAYNWPSRLCRGRERDAPMPKRRPSAQALAQVG